jgi:hypothetical protein
MDETTHTPLGGQELPPQMVLVQMCTGYLLSRALHVVAELGVADLLGCWSQERPRTCRSD